MMPNGMMRYFDAQSASNERVIVMSPENDIKKVDPLMYGGRGCTVESGKVAVRYFALEQVQGVPPQALG